MGLKDIHLQIIQDRKRQVQHETFGHLFPQKNSVFFGSIQVALTDYNDLIVLKDRSNVPSSPWWFASLMDFKDEFLKDKEEGKIFEIQIKSEVVKEKDGEVIKISNMGYKTVLE